MVALTENYSTSNPLKVSPEKSHILRCDIAVAYERSAYSYILLNVDTFYRTYITVHRLAGCTELWGSIKEEEFLG